MSEQCLHSESVKISKLSLHNDEFTIFKGQTERDLDHTYPVHEIHFRCRICNFEQTFSPREVPDSLKPFMEQIDELERQEKLDFLLDQLTEPVDLVLLDRLLAVDVDPSLLVGKIADWHGDPVRIVQLGDGRIALEVELTCNTCHTEKTLAYVGSGLHEGAFCYVFSYEGKFEADLRNDVFICEQCEREKQTLPEGTL